MKTINHTHTLKAASYYALGQYRETLSKKVNELPASHQEFALSISRVIKIIDAEIVSIYRELESLEEQEQLEIPEWLDL